MLEIIKRIDGNSLLVIHIKVTYLDKKVLDKILILFKNEIDLLKYDGYTKLKLRNDFLQIKYKIKIGYKLNSSFAFVYDKWKDKLNFYSIN